MPRTVIALPTGQWHIWGSDSGGPGYAFGAKDMLACEHIRSIEAPSGSRLDCVRRLYPDALAIELADSATPPDEIVITVETRVEGIARLRAEAGQC